MTRTVPVAQVIDPIPLRLVGNYLAFRMSVDVAYDLKWKRWLDDHGVEVGRLYDQDIVPLGTGGVFAEAVLGRSNSAEKLDITRFWDWQDSPIPLQPTEIAAIQTGSRGIVEDTSPGQLSTPIVNITSPTSLPDPVGTAAILQAVQNGSMFRDMSGLQATIGLVQAGIEQTMAGASAAGQQAGENMNNLLKATTERQRIGAELVSSLAQTAASAYTGGAIPPGGKVGGGGGGASSQQGAKINYFDKTAKSAAPGGAAGATGAQGGGSAPGITPGGASGGGQPAAPSTSYSQNPAALESVWGNSKSPSETAEGLIDKVGLTGIRFDAASAALESPGVHGAPGRTWTPMPCSPASRSCATIPTCSTTAGFGPVPRGHVPAQRGRGQAGGVQPASPKSSSLRASRSWAIARSAPAPRSATSTIASLRPRWPGLPQPPAGGLDAHGRPARLRRLPLHRGGHGRGRHPGPRLKGVHATSTGPTGWYSDVRFISDTSPAAMRNLPDEADTEVTIWLRTRSAPVAGDEPGRDADARTAAALRRHSRHGRCSRYWRDKRINPWEQKISEFEAAYLGATVAVPV